MRSGLPLPQAIQNAPVLTIGLEFYYNAFQELNSCRNFSGARISWLAMREYCNLLQMDDEEFADFSYVMRKIDDEYLNWQHTELSKA